MSLTSGRSLSHYRLVEKIGEGGMGVVWRATDTTLGRDVAIKVLPDAFAADPERLARFEREAKVLASLNHSHIASIYGLHTADGVRFVAMELADGENLAERIARGPLPIAEALAVALQIAEALESAHEHGVIHRDLKPANVSLSADGQVKLLDFGLAKALEGDGPGASAADLSRSPTITGLMTGANVILGTAAYMSPQQARGQATDKRADIWAFGVVLFEMLTGRQLFQGETTSDTLASVLKSEPDWALLPRETPSRVRVLARRCLERDVRLRLRDIGEARITLSEVVSGTAEEVPAAAAPPAPRRARLPLALVAVVGLAVGFAVALALGPFLFRPASLGAPLRKFTLLQRSDVMPTSVAISPDGDAVAYIAADHLHVQRLDALEPKELAHEQDMSAPFWSPDGQFVAYLAGTRVMKVAAVGGEAQTISDTRKTFSGGSGATWRENGTIVLSHAEEDGLLEVSARGGDPRAILLPDTTQESDFHDPYALPGGRGILFSSHRRKSGPDNIHVWDGRARRELLTLEGQGIDDLAYSPTGHIVFERTPNNSGVWALPFSLDRLEVTGEPFLVVPSGAGPSVSAEGTLVYLERGGGGSLQLVWVDATGTEIGTIGQPVSGAAIFPSLTRDGVQVAVGADEADNTDIWILDTNRGTKTRLTFSEGIDYVPVWFSSGDRIVYQVGEKGCSGGDCWFVACRSSDGSGSPDTLAAGIVPTMSSDDRYVLYTKFLGGARGYALVYRAVDGDATEITLVESKAWVFDGRVSPNGAYVAYTSEESGHREVFLRRFPSGEGKWQVSVSGGMHPRWNADGSRLYFTQGNDIIAVDAELDAAPRLGTPKKLFSRPTVSASIVLGWDPCYAVTGDGNRFVILRDAGTPTGPRGATVVQNWFAEFQDKGAK